MQHLTGRSVLILGLGISGLAMARWCLQHGARVQVWDSREQPPMAARLAQECPDAVLRSGSLNTEELLDLHWVLKSPGLAPHDARIAGFLAAARADRVRVAGELDLFVLALQALRETQAYQPQLLAITGTNGKTTTTQLTGLLVERCGKRVAVAGNIGPSLLDTLLDALRAQEADAQASPLPDVWVLELSSFQLDGVQDFEPQAAVVLNLTEDHLDWHGDFAAYAASKARVYGPAPRTGEDGVVRLSGTAMVVNRDCAAVMAMVPAPIPVKGSRGRPGRALQRTVISFGLDVPRQPGDFGVVVESGLAWLVRALPVGDESQRTSDDDTPPLQRLVPADALRIRGRHNAANALAALALASAIGCPLAPMLHGLREYAGEPHRLEFIARVADVDFYDDSKGTNVGATVAAISGLGADRDPARLVLLLGGDGKGQNFEPLLAPLQAHARAVALYGRDGQRLAQALHTLEVPQFQCETLLEALQWACGQTQPHDAVVLSPACASLDQFRDYKHRAEVFVQAVHEWAHEHGELA